MNKKIKIADLELTKHQLDVVKAQLAVGAPIRVIKAAFKKPKTGEEISYRVFRRLANELRLQILEKSSTDIFMLVGKATDNAKDAASCLAVAKYLEKSAKIVSRQHSRFKLSDQIINCKTKQEEIAVLQNALITLEISNYDFEQLIKSVEIKYKEDSNTDSVIKVKIDDQKYDDIDDIDDINYKL